MPEPKEDLCIAWWTVCGTPLAPGACQACLGVGGVHDCGEQTWDCLDPDDPNKALREGTCESTSQALSPYRIKRCEYLRGRLLAQCRFPTSARTGNVAGF
jgi:hypothetical protein